MKLKRVKIIGGIFILLGILLLIIAINGTGLFQVIVGIIGSLLTILGYILFLLFWKCPYCHKHLPANGLLGITTCPYCGNDLEL